MSTDRSVSVREPATHTVSSEEPDPAEAPRMATVFGIDVHLDASVPLLGRPRAAPTGRELHLYVQRTPTTGQVWPETGELICDERLADGTVNFRIESHPRAGYLIEGPGYGRHVISADAREIHCHPGTNREWQRLLIAQVLPFATVLRGLEALHASAVVLDERAIAIVGPSGSGKTSLALELCRSGADFLADDVLALEIRDGQLLGHPGTPVAGVDRAYARTTTAHPRPLHANERELLVAMPAASAPAPLAALFFLDRHADGPAEPRFEPMADPRVLLSATFNFVLSDPARLSKLLEVCALMATHRVERVFVGPSLDASRLGEAIARRVGARTR